MNTWDDLRELRRNGLKPSLPVIVMTDDRKPSHLLQEEGCLVVLHKAGEPFHVELLDGLRVWLFLRSCDRAQTVIRAMNAKDVKPAEFASWCECARCFDSQPVCCEVAKQWQ